MLYAVRHVPQLHTKISIPTNTPPLHSHSPLLPPYSELKDVSVDSRMRMHYFSTDTRPPYNGTFSRTSRVLTGRRPFEKDHKLFNYDYDSEAEWEEGDGEGTM